jgi:hypothetical protein
MDFRQFLNGSWMEMVYPSLTINGVSSTIQNEAQEAKKKKKIIKLQEV